MTIAEAARALRSRSVSSVELTNDCLAQIGKLNPVLNAFITVTADSALARAEELDRELGQGIDRGPLHGIPIAHKDLMRTKGRAHDVRIENLRRFRAGSRCRGGREVGGSGRRDGGESRAARTRVRDHVRQSAFWDHSKPAQSRAFAGRIERRVGSRGGYKDGVRRDGYRHGRLHPGACVVLRRRWAETDLWLGRS